MRHQSLTQLISHLQSSGSIEMKVFYGSLRWYIVICCKYDQLQHIYFQ